MRGSCERLHLSYLGKLLQGAAIAVGVQALEKGWSIETLCPSNVPGDAQSGVVLLPLFTLQRLKAHWKLSSWIPQQQSD